MPKLLTVGCAHLDDFDGAYFTLNSARLSIPKQYRPHVEYVVVDSGNGASKHSEMLRGLLSNIGEQAKYAHLPGGGTSTARNKVVELASGEFVLVVDPHVLLYPQSWERLLRTVADWSAGRDSKECPGLHEGWGMPHLVQGPLLMDDHRSISTHFFDRWEGEMWGKWGFGVSCTCGKTKFTPIQNGDKFECPGFSGGDDVRACPHCGADWSAANSEADLLQYGCVPLTTVDTALDATHWFEAPGQGLGLFLTAREHWLQFHLQATGFGAEEMCVHHLYRQAKRKAVILPFLLWQHRFGRPNGIPYTPDRYTKMRNYVLWFQRLGYDLEPIRKHFVDEIKVDAKLWEYLIADPVERVSPPKSCGTKRDPKQTLEDLFNRLKSVERDLNQHMPAMRSAVEGGVVVEITNRQESTVAFAAALPEELHSFQLEVTAEVNLAYTCLQQLRKRVTHFRAGSAQIAEIPECDLLFIDSEHTFERLSDELSRFGNRCRRFIVMHDTTSFGLAGDLGQGKRGLRHAIADFLYRNGEWGVAVHTDVQHGMTVLARRPEDRHPQFITFLPGRGYGPGTKMKEILSSLGINPSPTCDCGPVAAHMDALGVVGCRSYLPQIVQKVTDNAQKWGWVSFASAAFKAVTTGLALRINPVDPYGSLVRVAIEDADAEMQAGKLQEPIWR